MTASGTVCLRYFIATPVLGYVPEKTLLTNFGSAELYEFFYEKFARTKRRLLLSIFPRNSRLQFSPDSRFFRHYAAPGTQVLLGNCLPHMIALVRSSGDRPLSA
jgi:hypothetical protein